MAVRFTERVYGLLFGGILPAVIAAICTLGGWGDPDDLIQETSSRPLTKEAHSKRNRSAADTGFGVVEARTDGLRVKPKGDDRVRSEAAIGQAFAIIRPEEVEFVFADRGDLSPGSLAPWSGMGPRAPPESGSLLSARTLDGTVGTGGSLRWPAGNNQPRRMASLGLHGQLAGACFTKRGQIIEAAALPESQGTTARVG